MLPNKIKRHLIANQSLDDNRELILIDKIADKREFIEDRIQQYINQLEKSRRPWNTIQSFKILLSKIKEFHKEGRIHSYNLQERFFEDLALFLTGESGLINSSTNAYLQRIFTVLRYYNIPYKHNLPRYYLQKTAKHNIEDEILTEEEIENLWAYNPEEGQFKILRERALVSLYTGCRHSELESIFLSKDDRGNDVVGYYGQKDSEARYLAIHPRIKPILKKSAFKNPVWTVKFWSTMMGHIGVKGQGMELNRQAGQTVRSMVPRTEIVTFHSMRKTFAVRVLEAGMDQLQVSKLLGHSSLHTTMQFYSLIRSRQLQNNTREIFNKIK